MKKFIILILLLSFFTCILFGKKHKRYVIIKRGETLWRIARRYNCSVEVLCKINKIKDPTKVKAGQKIYLPYYKKERKKKKKKPGISFKLILPLHGRIIKFSKSKGIKLPGIYIKSTRPAPVKAVASGKVKFAGELKNLGKVVIIQHDKVYSTVYAHLQKLKVKTGERVRKYQVIGWTGKGTKLENTVYFQLLKYGTPVNIHDYFK